MRYNSPLFHQFLSFLLFLSFRATFSSSSSAAQLCSPDETAALLQFKTFFSINQNASTDCEIYGIRSYPKINSWKEGIDCCLWDGVSCDKITGQVIGLDLRCSWLSGTLHSNSSLFHLSHLQRLDLSSNDFKKSKISSKFGRFTSLTHLELSRSWFSGIVPYEISHLSKLVLLDLSFGSEIEAFEPILKLEKFTLSGIVRNLTEVREISLDGIDMSSVDPNSLMNLSYSLTSLSLSYCDLRGKFPEHIFNLPYIKFLTIDENPSLTGQFPKSNWSSPLEVLTVSVTSFSGELPESIGNLKSLLLLGLGRCNFSGSIPSLLGNLSQLFYLFLSHNNFSGNIPSSLAKLVNLTFLNLSSNKLNGTISLDMFSKLEFLDLHSNFFQGDLPALPRNIKFLSVSNNNLTGEISDICNLKFLDILDLSHNNFSGIIPQCIGSFSQRLSSLNLKVNMFHGIIPPTFAKGCGLKNLNLNSNQLEGPLTRSIKNCKDLEVLDLGNNKINDAFPDWIEALSELQVLVLRSNKFKGPMGTTRSRRSLQKLRVIDLSYNNLSGPLPTSYIKNFRGMIKLDEGRVVRYMEEKKLLI